MDDVDAVALRLRQPDLSVDHAQLLARCRLQYERRVADHATEADGAKAERSEDERQDPEPSDAVRKQQHPPVGRGLERYSHALARNTTSCATGCVRPRSDHGAVGAVRHQVAAYSSSGDCGLRTAATRPSGSWTIQGSYISVLDFTTASNAPVVAFTWSHGGRQRCPTTAGMTAAARLVY
jgi:hypothetical protein